MVKLRCRQVSLVGRASKQQLEQLEHASLVFLYYVPRRSGGAQYALIGWTLSKLRNSAAAHFQRHSPDWSGAWRILFEHQSIIIITLHCNKPPWLQPFDYSAQASLRYDTIDQAKFRINIIYSKIKIKGSNSGLVPLNKKMNIMK